MKQFLIIITCILLVKFSYGQSEGTKEITKKDAEGIGDIKTKGIKFGVSLGFNRVFDDLYDARISPIDTTLNLQKTSNHSFIISSTLSFPILKSVFGGKYYRKLDSKGNPVGDPYFVPSGLNFVATINLVTFNSALGGAGLFNQKLDGGLGLGYTFGDHVQLALTYEMISFRQPRDYVSALAGQQIKINGDNLTSLKLDDNDYFTDKYLPSISLKIIYTIN